MTFIVETFSKTPATNTVKRTKSIRRSHFAGARLYALRKSEVEGVAFVTISYRGASGRVLWGTAADGKYQPANDRQEMAPMPAAATKAKKPTTEKVPAGPKGPVKWKALPATGNGDRRIVGGRGKAVARVYTGGNADRAQASIDAIVALPGVVAAARELLSGELGKSKSKQVAALKAALKKMPDDETLRAL
jgi:hypothetical protein